MKRLMSVFSLLLLLLSYSVNTFAESGFDHSTTGFLLTGQHSTLACESCHLRGIFKGLPNTCEGCHDKFSQIGGALKPVTHVPTHAACDDCHTDNTWAAVRMDHTDITQACITCHNNTLYIGKPTGHIQSSDDCQDCHLTVAWTPARFDHFGITGSCINCHNNTIARGKELDHVESSDICEDCHSTNAWIPARFDHDGITTNCISCHNNVRFEGKPNNHYDTNDVCEDCHSVNAWSPATFDHTNINDGCDGCHNGANATGIDLKHLLSGKQCNVCHTVNGWNPILPYSHDSSNYPGDHTGKHLGCSSCHDQPQPSNMSVVTHPGYFPECAACHATDYRQDKHESAPVTDNLDCAGTCHKPNPQHRLSHSSWEN